MIKMINKIILVFLVINAPVNATSVSACKEIHWNPYQVYTVKSALHRRTHIILPEPIQGSPIPGSPQLWDVQAENIHLFIKPKNLGNKEGRETTVTVVSINNTSFDFNVTRVKRNPDTCIRIVHDTSFVRGQKNGWATNGQRENTRLESENLILKKRLVNGKHEKKELVEDALMTYRNNIFTGYSWENDGGFFGNNTVVDVWDDGRFTFVRLSDPKKGILTVTALIDGNEEMADYIYNPITKLYMISGLYPQFVLKYDDSEIEVKRSKEKG